MRLIGVVLAGVFLVAGFSAEASADIVGGIQKSWSSVSDTFTKSTKAGFQGMQTLSNAQNTVTQAACASSMYVGNRISKAMDTVTKAGIQSAQAFSTAPKIISQTMLGPAVYLGRERVSEAMGLASKMAVSSIKMTTAGLLGPSVRLTPEQREGIRKAGVRVRDYVSGVYSGVIQTAGEAYSAGVQFVERARGEVSGVERHPFLKDLLRYRPLLPVNDPADQLRRFQKGKI